MPDDPETVRRRRRPHALVGGELPADGSVFARMSLAEQRRFRAWLDGKKAESEEYIRGLMIR